MISDVLVLPLFMTLAMPDGLVFVRIIIKFGEFSE